MGHGHAPFPLLFHPLCWTCCLFHWLIDDYNWCRKNTEYQLTPSWMSGLADDGLIGVGSTMYLLLPGWELTTTEITLTWFLSLRLHRVLLADPSPDTGSQCHLQCKRDGPGSLTKYNCVLSLIHSNQSSLYIRMCTCRYTSISIQL